MFCQYNCRKRVQKIPCRILLLLEFDYCETVSYHPVLNMCSTVEGVQYGESTPSVRTQVCSTIFLLTGLRIYTGEYKAQGPTLCPTEGRALRGPQALDSPV